MTKPHLIHTLSTSNAKKLQLQQKRTINLLHKHLSFNQNKIGRCLHLRPWDAYERKTASCAYEQARVRLAANWLVKKYEICFIGSTFVTYVNSKYKVKPGRLNEVDPLKILRSARATIKAIKVEYPNLLGFMVLEINARKSTDGQFNWCPHLHLVIRGPTKEKIRKAILQPKGLSISDSRWLHVTKIYDHEILNYIYKFKPQFSVSYKTAAGATRSSNNKISLDLENEWLSFMATYSINDFIQLIGFSSADVKCFFTGEVAFPNEFSNLRAQTQHL